MVKYIILFIILFSLSFLEYLPMSNIIDRFHIEKICHYEESGTEYVKPCEYGLYCVEVSSNHKISVCQSYTPFTKFLEDSCSSTFECDINLECDNNKCTVKENSKAYEKIDEASNTKLFYCPNGMIAANASIADNDYVCKKKTDKNENKCYSKEEMLRYTPGFFKVCGKINGDSNNEINSIDANEIGSQENGVFVWDEKACKSGYAVYYPLNEDLSATKIDSMYKRCVTVTGVEKGDKDCILKYKIKNETEYMYNVDSVKEYCRSNTVEIDYKLFDKCQFLEKKLDLFKVYTKRLEELKTKGVNCADTKLYNESFTCGDNDLRKLWYSYNNPDLYLLYKDEPEVLNYLIKNAYPSYNEKNLEVDIEAKNESTGSSTYLDVQYFIALLLLLIF